MQRQEVLALLVVLVGMLGAPAIPAFAGQEKKTAPQAPKSDPAPLQPQVAMPGGERIVLLVRSALLTLNDAVQTGNFTVLRDVAAPGFREANSAAKLSQAFADLAQRAIDLSVVAVLAPQLAEAPTIDAKTNLLRIKGTLPGKPVQIDFDLLFQPVAGRWRLFGLSVQPKEAAQARVPNPPGPAAESGAKPPKAPGPDKKKESLHKK